MKKINGGGRHGCKYWSMCGSKENCMNCAGYIMMVHHMTIEEVFDKLIAIKQENKILEKTIVKMILT